MRCLNAFQLLKNQMGRVKMVSSIVKLICNTVSNNSSLSWSELLQVGALTAAGLAGWKSMETSPMPLLDMLTGLLVW